MSNPINDFFDTANLWKDEMSALRAVLSNTPLNEEFKWKQPCYTFQGNNIAIVGAFKAYCVLSFFKGTLLTDELNLLKSPGENSQATKMFCFTSVDEVLDQEDVIKAYVDEAIEVEKKGLKVDFKSAEEYDIPEELETFFDKDPSLKNAFYALTPGRQKGYLLHFSGAKQSKTRVSRIEKYIPRIMKGIGFHDCVCGQSKRMPTCDGSHNRLKGA